MTQDELIALAKQTAARHALAPEIVCAVVERESSWNPWAIRYEPAFRQRYVAPLGLPATEEVARSMSWGLMQTLGESVREIGYAGPLSQLCEPETGIEWGCRLFAVKLRRQNGDLHDALQAWNGGANPDYADEVLARAAKYR